MSHPRIPTLDSPPLVRYGLPERVFGTSPAAGTDFTQAVDARYFVRLMSVFCRLVTDATVASREVVLEYRDQAANRYDLMGAPVTVSATSTNDYCFSSFQGQADWPEDSSILVPLHPVILLPSDDFRLHIVNVQATDQLSRIRFVWERFYSQDQPPPDLAR